MENQLTVHQPIEALSLSEESLSLFKKFGINSIDDFLNLPSRNLTDMGITKDGVSRLYREAIIIKEGNIPTLLPISMNDLILLDFKLTKFRGKMRVWYLSVRTLNDEQYWIADEHIHQEKYILYSFENWLSQHKRKEIIFLKSSNYKFSQLIKRMRYYGLQSISMLSDSINWYQFCSMAILWGISTYHSQQQKLLGTDIPIGDSLEYSNLLNPENKKIILKEIISNTHNQFKLVINLINKFRTVF